MRGFGFPLVFSFSINLLSSHYNINKSISIFIPFCQLKTKKRKHIEKNFDIIKDLKNNIDFNVSTKNLMAANKCLFEMLNVIKYYHIVM